jgi:integrase/recombinase XerD
MLQRQAKVLGPLQVRALLSHVEHTRYPIRNRAIVQLSVRAGLRAKEIALLEWRMVTDAGGELGNVIRLEDRASKGSSGGSIPMAKELRSALLALRQLTPVALGSARVIQTERGARTSPQTIINLFQGWFAALGMEGCSSHSGRRTFITMAARNIGRFGGSLRDVQALARHSSLGMTQRYIEVDSRAMERVVDGW